MKFKPGRCSLSFVCLLLGAQALQACGDGDRASAAMPQDANQGTVSSSPDTSAPSTDNSQATGLVNKPAAPLYGFYWVGDQNAFFYRSAQAGQTRGVVTVLSDDPNFCTTLTAGKVKQGSTSTWAIQLSFLPLDPVAFPYPYGEAGPVPNPNFDGVGQQNVKIYQQVHIPLASNPLVCGGGSNLAIDDNTNLFPSQSSKGMSFSARSASNGNILDVGVYVAGGSDAFYLSAAATQCDAIGFGWPTYSGRYINDPNGVYPLCGP